MIAPSVPANGPHSATAARPAGACARTYDFAQRYDSCTSVDEKIPLRSTHQPKIAGIIIFDPGFAQAHDAILSGIDRVPEIGNRPLHLGISVVDLLSE
jgi:hypothetical protein